MHRFSRQGLIKAQPHQVFDFVTDQSKLPLWSPEVVSSEITGGGSLAPGMKLTQVRRQGVRTMTNTVEVIAHDRPKSHAVRTRILGVEMTFAFSFWPEGSSTKVTFDCTCEGKGLGKILEGTMAKMVEKADDQRIERLKAAMEKRP